MTKVLRGLDVPLDGAVIHDGSGLSRADLMPPATLLGVLGVAAATDRPELRAVVTGLPVAGFTGSLAFRFDDGKKAGRGRVRAKTGTLSGVHGLAGVTTDLDGNVLTFVLLADKVAARGHPRRPRHPRRHGRRPRCLPLLRLTVIRPQLRRCDTGSALRRVIRPQLRGYDSPQQRTGRPATTHGSAGKKRHLGGTGGGRVGFRHE